MNLVNNITMKIIKNARNGESIRSLANRVGFAYSAVYNWILKLEKYEVIKITKKGNKNIIKINKNLIYKKFKELDYAISIIDKTNEFWKLVKRTKLKIRFVKGTAIAIWTKGGFFTGDFHDRVYFLEVAEKDLDSLKNKLKNKEIPYTESKLIHKRPLVYIIPKKEIKIERILNYPVMPLNELLSYCKKLYLEKVLEELDLMYNLNLNIRYSEVYTNI